MVWGVRVCVCLHVNSVYVVGMYDGMLLCLLPSWTFSVLPVMEPLGVNPVFAVKSMQSACQMYLFTQASYQQRHAGPSSHISCSPICPSSHSAMQLPFPHTQRPPVKHTSLLLIFLICQGHPSGQTYDFLKNPFTKKQGVLHTSSPHWPCPNISFGFAYFTLPEFTSMLHFYRPSK